MCGIAAVYNPKNHILREGRDLALGVQHRGYESAGFAVSTGDDILVYKDAGLVNEVFYDAAAKMLFSSRAGIAHTRYSTTGISGSKNAQPIRIGDVALGHNGNLVNMDELTSRFSGRYKLSTTTDSELITCLFNDSVDFFEGAERCHEMCRGTYNLVLLNTKGEIGVFRDPSGNHPLFVGEDGDSFYAASEDFAFGHLNLDKMREMEPGEMIVVSSKGIDRKVVGSGTKKKICSFEPVYFMNYGSTFRGNVISDIRRNIGRRLAQLYPIEADLVVPVLESGLSYCFGYSEESGIPMSEAIPKNLFVGRTYMLPEGKDGETPEILRMTRSELVRLKHRPIRSKVKGKRIILTDDSIVRKNVSSVITRSLQEAGATEIHWRVGYPPVRFPCFYGLDHARRRQLAAAPFEDPIDAGNHVAEQIGANSVRYIPMNELRGILGDNGDLCFSCVDGAHWGDVQETDSFREAMSL